jgi:hypothetical protein
MRILDDFRVGSDLRILLGVVGADPATVTITAAMRKIATGQNGFEPGSVAITLTTALNAAPTTIAPAGFYLSCSHTVTATLPPGVYAIDARLEIPGSTEITKQAGLIRLSQGVV